MISRLVSPCRGILTRHGVRFPAIVFAVAALMSYGHLPTVADTVTWTGGGTDANWGTGANWDGGSAPLATETAAFTSTAAVTLAANHTVQVLDFGAHTLALSGSHTLTLNPVGSNNIVGSSGGVLSIGGGATVDVNGRTHSGNQAYVIEIAGAGVGGGGAIVNRGGTLTNTNGFSMLRLTADAAIGGTGRLDFGSGGWIDSQGFTLTKAGTNDTWLSSPAYNAANPSGTTNLPEVIVNGGLFGLQASNVLANSSNVTVNAGARLGVWGNVSQQNNVILSGGQLRSVHSNFPVNNSTATWNAGTAGILDVQADSTLLTSQANMRLNIPLSGNGNLTRTASTGSTDARGTENLTLNGNNIAWTGALRNNGGKVTIGHVNALGASAVTHEFNPGSTLDLAGFDLSGQPHTIALGGVGIPIPIGDPAAPDGYAPPGVLINSGASPAAIGRATLTADATIGGGDITLSGVVDGGFALTRFGAGTLTLGAANSWGGATNLHEGTIALDADNALPTTTTLALGNDSASGTLRLGGRSQQMAGLLTAGTGTDNRVVNDAATAGSLTLNIAGGVTNTFAGVLGGATADENRFSLTKDGPGTLNLTTANSYTGTTTVAQGRLIASHPNALGAASAGIEVADGAALVINHGSAVTEPITLNGVSNPDGALQSGTVSTNWSVNSPITLAATSNVGTPSRSMALRGKITGPGGLIKVHGNTLYLASTANDYAGPTIINGGSLRLINGDCIPDTSDLTINNGANLNLVERPLSTTVALVTINDGQIQGTDITVVTSHSGFRLHKGTVSAVLGGSGELWKESGDTFTLSRANLYTGDTRVNAGRLALSGEGSIHGSPAIHIAAGATFDVSAVAGGTYSLAAGQTLGGGGSVVGDLIVTDGSSLSPGASPGTLTHTGNQTWLGGGSYLWEINNPNTGAGADPGWDFLDVSGTLTIDATEANPFVIDVISLTADNTAGLLAGFSAAVDYSWPLATAAEGIVGFAPDLFDIRLDHFANAAGGRWQVGLTGNSLVLNYIPEPSAFLMAVLGLLAAVFRRPSRR